MAAWSTRGTLMVPTALLRPLASSTSSTSRESPRLSSPPVTRMEPDGSRVARCPPRPDASAPMGPTVPVRGSKRSMDSDSVVRPHEPPTRTTLPSPASVAVCCDATKVPAAA